MTGFAPFILGLGIICTVVVLFASQYAPNHTDVDAKTAEASHPPPTSFAQHAATYYECMDDALHRYENSEASAVYGQAINYNRGVLDWHMQICERMFPPGVSP